MKKNTKIIIIAVLVVAIVATAGLIFFTQKDKSNDWLYWNVKYEDLINTEEYDNQAVLYLQEIHNTPYYTNDAIAKAGKSAYSFMLLSQMEKEELSALTAYTDSLSLEQLDFLALQIENAIGLSLDVIKGDKNATALFESIDIDEKDYKDVSEENLTDLYKFLYEIFDEKGVKHEWKLFDSSDEYSFEEFFK